MKEMIMRGLQLPSQPHSSEVQTLRELADLSVQIKERWPGLDHPFISKWTQTPLVGVDRSDVPWIIGPVERDPLRDARGRTVIPERELTQLKKIAEWGMPFQRIAIAHELEAEGPVNQLLPALRAGPQPCTDEVARALVGRVPAHPGVTRLVRIVDAAVRGATSVVPVNVVVNALDPIILGVIAPTPPQHDQLCLWYRLVDWLW
jgi:hypothetical protein